MVALPLFRSATRQHDGNGGSPAEVRFAPGVIAAITRQAALAVPGIAGVEDVDVAVSSDGTAAIAVSVSAEAGIAEGAVATVVHAEVIDRVERMTSLTVANARVALVDLTSADAPPSALDQEEEVVAAAVLGCGLIAGLAGRRPVLVGPHEVEVHVVARWSNRLDAVADEVKRAVDRTGVNRRVVVHIDDLEVPILVPPPLLP